MDKLYKEDSIESLTPLEHVRLRPGMYAGDTSDATQLAIEILGNAIDEYKIGHGNKILVSLKDDYVEISDEGQGFPINVMREDGKTVLQASFDCMNTSGKYRDDGVYEGTAIGLNGIGSKLTNFLSNWLEVISYNQYGKYEKLTFKEGVLEERMVGLDLDHHSGTIVRFKPSPQFFNTPEVNKTKITKFCNDITCICSDLTIVLDGKEISHKDGINDLITYSLGKDEEIIDNRFTMDDIEGKQRLYLGLSYSNKSNVNIVPYVNCGLTQSGPHITTLKSTLTRCLNRWAKENGFLSEKDKNLDGASLQEGLVLVCNITAEGVAYDAQVKSTITKIDTTFIASHFAKKFEVWLDNNPSDAQEIIDKALIAKRAAEAAKRAREKVKAQAGNKKKIKFPVMPSKLADCSSKDRSICELYVTEGDSASGGAKTIRDAKTQAIMGLRGKCLNCLTAKPESILKNNEVVDILKALGLEYEVVDKKVKVDYNKHDLRYGKFIIAADRDSDGAHIQSLVLTMLWTLVPDLIIDGYVFIAEPPLYKAEWGNDYKYLSNKQELEEFKKEHKGDFTLTYFKGLGEASPQELGWMIMNPKTRKIRMVTVDDIGVADMTFNDLMGRDPEPKKNFVFGHKIENIM